jgi:hypothetical protein
MISYLAKTCLVCIEVVKEVIKREFIKKELTKKGVIKKERIED